MYYLPTQFQKDVNITQLYTIHYFEYDKDYKFSGESHNFWELLYIDRGEAVASLNETCLLLECGQLLLYEPGVFHTISANGNKSLNTVVISFDCADSCLDCLKNKVFFAGEAEKAMIAEIVSEAKLTFKTNLGDPKYRQLEKNEDIPFGSLQLIQLHLETMFIGWIRKHSALTERLSASTIEQQNKNSEKFADVAAYIERNLDKPLTLESISRSMALSVSGLEFLFRKYVKMGPVQYCRHKKIEAAKRMIREGRMNFTQISEALAFSSLHYFSRTFQQIAGMSPSEYSISTKAMIDHSNEVKTWSQP